MLDNFPAHNNIVRYNLMNEKDYTPYCGNEDYRACRMPRTKFNGEQFVCPVCKWSSELPEDFIKEYKEKWNPVIKEEDYVVKWN